MSLLAKGMTTEEENEYERLVEAGYTEDSDEFPAEIEIARFNREAALGALLDMQSNISGSKVHIQLWQGRGSDWKRFYSFSEDSALAWVNEGVNRAEKLNEDGWNIYVTCNPQADQSKRDKKTVPAYRENYVDVDSGKASRTIEEVMARA